MSQFIRNRPITSFLLLTFAISYVIGIPFNFAVSSMLDAKNVWATYLPRLITVFGPAIAAIVVSRSTGEATRLIRSLRIPLRHGHWILVSIIVGILLTIVPFALAGDSLPIPKNTAPLLSAHFLIQVFMIGIGEELGWRGWMLPALLRKRSFASATALTGLAWIFWHGPVFLSGLSLAVSFVALLAAMSIVLAFLWIATEGSAGVVAIAHASVNAPFFFYESHIRERAGGHEIVMTAFGYHAAMCVCLAIVAGVAAWRGRSLRRLTPAADRIRPIPHT